MLGDFVADDVCLAEPLDPSFVGSPTGAEGGRDHENRFRGQAADLLGELAERDFVFVEGRYQSASELDFGLTPSQHNIILPSVFEVA